jgi:hypothetical protein
MDQQGRRALLPAVAASPTPNTPSTSIWPWQKNNDNPVYYVQYAHARICSVLAAWGGDASELGETDLSPLDSPRPRR